MRGPRGGPAQGGPGFQEYLIGLIETPPPAVPGRAVSQKTKVFTRLAPKRYTPHTRSQCCAMPLGRMAFSAECVALRSRWPAREDLLTLELDPGQGDRASSMVRARTQIVG